MSRLSAKENRTLSLERHTPSPVPDIHPKHIGFDIDGVVADTSSAFIRIAHQEYGLTQITHEAITEFEVARCFDVDPAIVDAIFERLLMDPLGSGLSPMPHAVEVLTEFSRHAPLSFITARPQHEPIARWLAQILGPALFDNARLVAMGDHDGKSNYIKEMDLRYFVDDRSHTCHLLAREGITPIVYDQPWNRGRHDFIAVDDWPAIRQLCNLAQ